MIPSRRPPIIIRRLEASLLIIIVLTTLLRLGVCHDITTATKNHKYPLANQHRHEAEEVESTQQHHNSAIERALSEFRMHREVQQQSDDTDHFTQAKNALELMNDVFAFPSDVSIRDTTFATASSAAETTLEDTEETLEDWEFLDYLLPADISGIDINIGDDNYQEIMEAVTLNPSKGEGIALDSNTTTDDFNITQREDEAETDNILVTASPTLSSRPSMFPTFSPFPTASPSDEPTQVPSAVPTLSPAPSNFPSSVPSATPTDSSAPSASPSFAPSRYPSDSPSDFPSTVPSADPTNAPSSIPSQHPSRHPSSTPSKQPSSEPSSAPSSAPTLTCHDEPDYQSPINGFVCQDHVGTSCLQWRYLGLTLDDLEQLIISCPVSCGIDCGTLERWEVTVSYQIANVPGLMDAAIVNQLNTLTKTYLINYLGLEEPLVQFFVDEVELLSQRILNRNSAKRQLLQLTNDTRSDRQRTTPDEEHNRELAEELVNLWVTSAIRGFAFNVSTNRTTELLVAGIASPGYTRSIQNADNEYLKDAIIFSASEKGTAAAAFEQQEESTEDETDASTTVIVVVVIFAFGGLLSIGLCVHRKRRRYQQRSDRNRLLYGWSLFNSRRRRKLIDESERVQSPQRLGGLPSPEGSAFSFDETGTVGTNGLMRFIQSFSRSGDSTSPDNSSVLKSTSNDETVGTHPTSNNQQKQTRKYYSGDEEMGPIPSTSIDGEDTHEEESESVTSDDPHPLTGMIPPMVVYDGIDDNDDTFARPELYGSPRKQRNPSVVPSKHVEANDQFRSVLGNRDRPSATSDLAEYLNATSNFVSDPLFNKNRLESGRPSPLGIVMDSDDDDVSIASTPVQRQDSISRPQLRKTRSLDDVCALESLGDVVISEYEYAANISPIEPAILEDSSVSHQELVRPNHNVVPCDSPGGKSLSSEHSGEEAMAFTWIRAARTSATPETPRQPYNHPSSAKAKSTVNPQEQKASFWKRSPLAKGVKDAFWSKKNAGVAVLPTANNIRRNSSANNLLQIPPSPPPNLNRNHDRATRRGSMNTPPPTPPPRNARTQERDSKLPPPTPNDNQSDFQRQSLTPTQLEGSSKYKSNPARSELSRWQNPSPSRERNCINESQGGIKKRFLKSRSASFGTGRGASAEEEAILEYRAPRIGRLGLLINASTSNKTGPIVEAVKGYSTLFGCVHPGDKIIEVDGVNTVHLTIQEVLKLLSGTNGMRSDARDLNIKVARSTRERNEDRASLNSHGSGNQTSSFTPHRRNQSDHGQYLDRLSLNGHSDHSLSNYSYNMYSNSEDEEL